MLLTLLAPASNSTVVAVPAAGAATVTASVRARLYTAVSAADGIATVEATGRVRVAVAAAAAVGQGTATVTGRTIARAAVLAAAGTATTTATTQARTRVTIVAAAGQGTATATLRARGNDWAQTVPTITYTLRTAPNASLILNLSDVLPGQVGSATTYTGTQTNAAQQRAVRFGVNNDDYDYALMWTPHNYDRYSQAPVVLYSHGATGNEQQPLKDATTGVGMLLNEWLKLGWVVISCRLGTTGVVSWDVDNNDGKWGNQPSRVGAMASWAWLGQWITRPRGLLLYGFSAGGMFTLNHMLHAKQIGVPILGAVLVDPATNLRYNYTSEGSSRAKDIRDAYGISSPCTAGDAQWVSKVDDVNGGHDPHYGPHLTTLAALPYVPVMLSASYGDQGVSRANNADIFRTRLQANGWVETVGGTSTAPELFFRSTSGGHGDSSHFSKTVDIPFMQRALAWGV